MLSVYDINTVNIMNKYGIGELISNLSEEFLQDMNVLVNLIMPGVEDPYITSLSIINHTNDNDSINDAYDMLLNEEAGVKLFTTREALNKFVLNQVASIKEIAEGDREEDGSLPDFYDDLYAINTEDLIHIKWFIRDFMESDLHIYNHRGHKVYWFADYDM